jgi:glycosyltransferase involved in cell wall biosynthesis
MRVTSPERTTARRDEGGRRLRVLISAYACEPGKGSEPGAGWLWALAAAGSSDVCVLTRANNRAAIEADPAGRSESLRFVYLDLPDALRRCKRGDWSVRPYYLLWQLLAMRAARRLHAAERFDVVHHLTFANAWLPALVSVLDAPFVLGPVGGGLRVAAAHYPALGPAGAVKELALRSARGLAGASPLVRLGWRRASVILLNNEETGRALPRRIREKAFLRPAQCAEGMAPAAATAANAPPTAVYAGRLHRFKGLELALRAVARTRDWRLVLVGAGPDEPRLRALARELAIESRIVFGGSVRQRELWALMADCDVFLLPSLKEGGGFAAFEAAALGLPVVAFDAGGPAAVARFYPEARFELVAPRAGPAGLADALDRLGKRRQPGPSVDAGVEAVGRDLERVYRRAFAARKHEPENVPRASARAKGAGA